MIYNCMSIIYKPSKNPQVEEFLKNSSERQLNLSRLNYVIREDGSKGCVWCGDVLKSKHPNTRYCKDDNCQNSALAYLNPQGVEGRHYLLIKQNFRCAHCQFSWKPFIEEAYQEGKSFGYMAWNKDKDYTEQVIWWLWKRCWPPKDLPDNKGPEVDHIIAIVNGGQALGFDNHQVLCKECHIKKTKEDMIAMRKNPPPKKEKIPCAIDTCRKKAKWICPCGINVCESHWHFHWDKIKDLPFEERKKLHNVEYRRK